MNLSNRVTFRISGQSVITKASVQEILEPAIKAGIPPSEHPRLLAQCMAKVSDYWYLEPAPLHQPAVTG